MYKKIWITALALSLSNSIAVYAQDDSLELLEDVDNNEELLQCTEKEIKWECDEPADPPVGEENIQAFTQDLLMEFEEELNPKQEILPEENKIQEEDTPINKP